MGGHHRDPWSGRRWRFRRARATRACSCSGGVEETNGMVPSARMNVLRRGEESGPGGRGRTRRKKEEGGGRRRKEEARGERGWATTMWRMRRGSTRPGRHGPAPHPILAWDPRWRNSNVIDRRCPPCHCPPNPNHFYFHFRISYFVFRVMPFASRLSHFAPPPGRDMPNAGPFQPGGIRETLGQSGQDRDPAWQKNLTIIDETREESNLI